jgi:hypothetical protein
VKFHVALSERARRAYSSIGQEGSLNLEINRSARQPSYVLFGVRPLTSYSVGGKLTFQTCAGVSEGVSMPVSVT